MEADCDSCLSSLRRNKTIFLLEGLLRSRGFAMTEPPGFRRMEKLVIIKCYEEIGVMQEWAEQGF